MSAAITNAATNGLHAAFLLLYFLGALLHRRRGEGAFTPLAVWLFGLLFVLKLLGVYVHYFPPGDAVRAAWGVISGLVIALNYLVLQVVGAPRAASIAAALASAVAAVGFVFTTGDFTFIALPGVLVFLAAAHFSSGLLRAGFLLVVASNAAWILARKLTAAALGGSVPLELRYDNDVYHFLLIISTFVIYKALALKPHRDR